MSIQAECELMQQLTMFRDVDETKRKLIAMSSEHVVFSPGDVVYEEGGAPDGVFLMLRGHVRVIQQTETTAMSVAELAGGTLLGEIGVLCGRPRTSTVIATERCEMLRLDAAVFLELLAQTPQVAVAVARELASRLDATNRRLLELGALSPNGSTP